jgi:general stress protein 26
MGASMTEDEAKEVMTKRTILHIGTVDYKGESNVTPVGTFFDNDSNMIYIPTHKNSKKVRNLSNKRIISFCVDDPIPPYRELEAKEKAEFMKRLIIMGSSLKNY